MRTSYNPHAQLLFFLYAQIPTLGSTPIVSLAMTAAPAIYDYTPRLPRPYRSKIKTMAIGAFLAFLFMVPVVTGAAIYANAPKTLPDHTVITDTDPYTPSGDEPPVVDAVVEKS